MTEQEILKAPTIFLKGNTKPYEKHQIILGRIFYRQVMPEEIPKGWYRYFIRYKDNLTGPGTIEKFVIINFYGSLLVSHPISLGQNKCFTIKEHWYGAD